jgi:two-component system sensor histidine kinase MprB
MNLRARLAVFFAVGVAIAATAVAWAAFTSARDETRGEVDTLLTTRAAMGAAIAPAELPPIGFPASTVAGGSLTVSGAFPGPNIPIRNEIVVHLVNAAGGVLFSSDATIALPVSELDRAVAAGGTSAVLRDIRIDGTHYRMITAPAGPASAAQPQMAVQLAHDLTSTDTFLAGMRLRLIAIGSSVVLLAGIAAWLLSRRVIDPVSRLTAAAESISVTGNLDLPITVVGNDEIGRLAASFNSMLEALASARRQQQQLVEDASHELRTPLTSLRTNIQLLSRAGTLPEGERAEILADAEAELKDLSALVVELVDLAAAGRPDEPWEELDLGATASMAVERFRRRTGREVRLEAEPSMVRARASRVQSALANLLDNAHKWSPPGRAIEVSVHAGRVAVTDHGPGIEPGDLPHIFDRFYRSSTARAMPGSGLGLAIVQQVAGEHGGSAFAARGEDGGAVVGFQIPGRSPGAPV